MKALSVKQPWASLIESGRKTLEIRSWRTHYRGPLVIVASGAPAREPLTQLKLADAPLGVTLALVDLVDAREAITADAEAACCTVPPDVFARRLANPRRIERVPVRGRLNVWTIDNTFVRRVAA